MRVGHTNGTMTHVILCTQPETQDCQDGDDEVNCEAESAPIEPAVPAGNESEIIFLGKKLITVYPAYCIAEPALLFNMPKE